MALVAKSTLLGDFGQSALGMSEQMTGAFDPLVDQVLVGCQSRCLLEPSSEMEGTQAGGARNAGQREIFCEVFPDVLDGASELVWG
jgi:hypothetical protein